MPVQSLQDGLLPPAAANTLAVSPVPTPPLPTPSPTLASLLDADLAAEVVGTDPASPHEPQTAVDYLSHDFALDEIFPARRALDKYCNSDSLLRARLDNVLWRVWGRQAWDLEKQDPRDLNWHKDADTGFLYGPLPRTATPGPGSDILRTSTPERMADTPPPQPARTSEPASPTSTPQQSPPGSPASSPRRHRRRTSSAPATVFPKVRPLAPILKPRTPRTLWDLLISSVATGDVATRQRVVSLVGQQQQQQQRNQREDDPRSAKGTGLNGLARRKKDDWRHDSGTVLESSSSDDSLSDVDAMARHELIALNDRPMANGDRPPLFHPIPRLNLVIDLSLPHPVTLDTPTRNLSRAGKKTVNFVEEVEQAVIVEDESDVDEDELLDEDEFDDEEEAARRRRLNRKPAKPMTRRIGSAKLSQDGLPPPPPPPAKPKKSLASSIISAPIPGREQIETVVDRGIDVWENVKELATWLGVVAVAGAFARVS